MCNVNVLLIHVLLLSGESYNIASVLCPIPFRVNEIKYVKSVDFTIKIHIINN